MKKLFRVAVAETYVMQHSRKLNLSGRTEADKRVVINSRANGEVKEVRVKRGSLVKTGDIIAVLSDEAREAQVVQAQSLVTQRRTELEAKRPAVGERRDPAARRREPRSAAQDRRG